MSRWNRTYELYREANPTPAGDSGLNISRGGSGTTTPHRADRRPESRAERRPGRAIARPEQRQDLPLREFADLLRSERPQLLSDGDRAYRVTGRQIRALATIGAFRAVPADDLRDRQLLSKAELDELRAQGLIHQRTVSLEKEPRTIVTLSKEARRVLEAHRGQASEDGQGAHQALHAGLVKPAELPHDAHLYALYEVAAAEIASQGATVDRVQLDYELKRDYQTWLHRADRDPGTPIEDERQAWADAHGLPLVDGELHLPDLRIEYTDADGHAHVHDVELVTVHYSARAVAAKRSAGFALYRHGSAPRPYLFERLV